MLDKIGQTQDLRQVAGTVSIHHRYTVGVAVEPVWAGELSGAPTNMEHYRPVAEWPGTQLLAET